MRSRKRLSLRRNSPLRPVSWGSSSSRQTPSIKTPISVSPEKRNTLERSVHVTARAARSTSAIGVTHSGHGNAGSCPCLRSRSGAPFSHRDVKIAALACAVACPAGRLTSETVCKTSRSRPREATESFSRIVKLAARHESLFANLAAANAPWRPVATAGVVMRTAMPHDECAAVATCGIAIMAKASIPGRTKTRLVPPLTFDEAAQCNTAFLRDVADTILAASGQASIAGYAAFAPPQSMPFFQDNVPREIALIEASYPSLGDCLDQAIAQLLA